MMRYGLMLVASVVLLLAACDSDESGGPSGDGVFMELLRLVPDDPAYRSSVVMGDVERTLEVLGIERPSGEYDEAVVQDFVIEVFQADLEGFRGALPAFFAVDTEEQFALSANADRSLGFSILDVEQWVITGQPPEMPAAIRGSFDPGEIAATLEACDECPPAETEDRSGWTIYAWGEDLEMDLSRRGQPPLFDSLGRAGRLAVSEHLIARTLATGTARAMVDAYDGTGSLADVEEFRLAVTALTEMDALGVMVSDVTMGPELAAELPDHITELWEVREGDTVLVPYEVFAVGPGWDEGPYTAVALVHASEADAEENARRFEDRVNSTRMFTGSTPENLADHVDGVEVEVDGRVLRARINGYALGIGGFGGPILLAPIPLLVHE